MSIRSRLFGGDMGIPLSVPAMPEQKEVESARRVLEASRHVEDRFHVDVDDEALESALVAIGHRGALAATFQEHDIPMLDSDAVSRYQQARVRSTFRERFAWGWRRFSSRVSSYMLHMGWVGVASAMLSLLVTIPLGIPLLIDRLYYDVTLDASYVALFVSQCIFLWCGLLGVMLVQDKREDFEIAIRWVGKRYAALNYGLLGYPSIFLASLVAACFMHIESGRTWKTTSVQSFFGKKVPLTEAVIIMDKILEVAPDAKLQFEALVNPDGTRDGEVFLSVDYGGSGTDTLHLWHGRA